MAVAIPTHAGEASDVTPGAGVRYPAGWKIEALGDYVDIVSGESPSQFTFAASGTPYFKVDQLNNSNKYLGSRQTPYFTVNARTVPAGSVIFPKRGASIRLNKVRLLAEPAYMDTNLMAITARAGVLSEYLYYLITYVKLWTFADTTSIPQINNKHIKPLMIPVPPISEQRAIARALTDIDKSIDVSEDLIAKKRAIKLGVVQRLVTGATRLPGFSGEWVTKRLGDTAVLKARIGWQGLTTAEYLETGYYRLVGGTEFRDGAVAWNRCAYVDEYRYRQDKNIQLQEDDVLVTKDGTIGKVALVTHLDKPATLNSGVFVIRPLDGAFHPKFFYHLLRSKVFVDFLSQLSAGSTIHHLYQKDFVGFRYSTPPSISEQVAIANILSDMDEEIVRHEERQAKIAAVKVGMMQALLSGSIRLLKRAT